MLVVGAVIVRDGRVLAGLRSGRGWEFPGGKVEPGESPAAALARECREELGVGIAPIRELGSAADGDVTLHLWLADLTDGEPTASTDHGELRWVAAEELDELDWLPLDRDMLPLIRAGLGNHDGMRFRATVELGGKTATGIHVPDNVIAALGTSQRPAVAVTIGAHTYRTTVAKMGGRYLVPLSAENRTAAGVAAGDEVDVEIALDQAPREVTLPADLESAMDAGARSAYDALSFTYRKEWVRWVDEAKKPETRATRIEKTVSGLKAGKKTH